MPEELTTIYSQLLTDVLAKLNQNQKHFDSLPRAERIPSINSQKTVELFLKKRLVLQNGEALFLGEDRYEPVYWSLKDKYSKIVDYIVQRNIRR